MKILATFANRKYDAEEVELIHAWDLETFEMNPTGYEDEKQAAIASLGSDLLRHVTAEIVVDDQVIRDALNPAPVVEGRINTLTPGGDA